MNELRGGADEPERGDRPERRSAGDAAADVDSLRQSIEPRSRAEYAADLRQQVDSGWDRWQSFGPRMSEPLNGRNDPGRKATDRGSSRAGDAAEDPVDRPDKERQPDTPLDAVRRFEPRRAGLPEISTADAVTYIDAHCAERPWLATARGCSPEVQRVFAALDQSGGHGHIRHEGWVTEEMNERRVAYLEDPAQPDLAKRAAGIDGIKSGDRPHRCGSVSTRIADPDAFAVAMARGLDHSDVQGALEKKYEEGEPPDQVILPIADLLGSDGHRYCTGWQLDTVDGSMKTAREQRDAWAAARAGSSIPDVPEPKARPIETFDGGSVVFTFGPNRVRNGYEIVTMYVHPPMAD